MHSIVEYLSSHDGYRCGYCHKTNENYSHGMWCHTLTVDDYSALVNRGWRRSGKYCYKPTLNKACCPQYAIRCECENFVLSKSQKKVLRRMNRFLRTGIRPGQESVTMDAENSDMKSNDSAQPKVAPSAEEKYRGSQETSAECLKSNDGCILTVDSCPSPSTTCTPSVKHEKYRPPKVGDGADPNKPKCVKSKILKRQRYLEKCSSIKEPPSPSTSLHVNKNPRKSLEEFLAEYDPESSVHKLKILLVRSSPQMPQFNSTFSMSHSIYQKYQIAVHGDTKEKCNKNQFTRFLVTSPLQEEHKHGMPHGYGSFHQQYWLDDRLIAVGVIDILPTFVSSVYLYYDPDFSFLSLGTYSILIELDFTRKLHKISPQLQYYYIGLYVQSCPKLRYKGNYYPSFLLCPETYKWFPIEGASAKIENNKYSRLNENKDEGDPDKCLDTSQVLIFHDGVAYPYGTYRRIIREKGNEPYVSEYAAFVGTPCANRMILVLHDS